MAHAFDFENLINNGKFCFINTDALNEFYRLAFVQMAKINNATDTFFRSYGGANIREFFAVSVEMFFEKSYEFNREKPEVYLALVKILKMNPLLISNNRVVDY